MTGVSVSVNDLEQQLANAKMLVERRDRALRLSSNPDFRAIILDEFCTTEAARYVQASADPALSNVTKPMLWHWLKLLGTFAVTCL